MDYVCVLDIDEFLHPDTLKLLEQSKPLILICHEIMCGTPEKGQTQDINTVASRYLVSSPYQKLKTSKP